MLKYEKDTEKEKFKEMDFRMKLQHIMEYYKWHIIGSIVGVLAIYSLLNLYIFNPPADPSVQIVFGAPYIDDTAMADYKVDLQGVFPELVNEEMDIMMTPIMLGDDTMGQGQMAYTQKFMAMITARDIDIIIGDKGSLMSYAKSGYFVDLEDIMDTTFLEEYKDKLVDVEVEVGSDQSEVETQKSFIMADNEKLKELLPATENIMVGIVINTQRMDNAMDVFEYIIK